MQTPTFIEISEKFQKILIVVGHSQEEAKTNTSILFRTILTLTLQRTLAQLPEEKQAELTKILKKQDPASQENLEIVTQLLSSEEISKDFSEAVSEVTAMVLDQYFSTISPKLNRDQKKEISSLIQSLSV